MENNAASGVRQSSFARGSLAAAVGLLLIVAFGTFHSSRESLRAHAWVEQSLDISNHFLELLSLMQNIETGTRGFILSRHSSFLEPYESATNRFDETQAHLSSAIKGNTEHEEAMVRLAPLVRDKVLFQARLIELGKAGEFEEAIARIETGEGQKLMDRIRAIVSQAVKDESERLASFRARAQRETIQAALFLVGSQVVAILIVVGLILSLRRSTDRHRLLLEERDRLFNLSPDMLCTANFDGFFTEVNPSFERILGWMPAELYDKPFMDFVHPDDRAATTDAMAGLIEGKPIFSFENRYRCRDGSYRWVNWSSYPIPQTRRVYAIARDTTERRNMEQTQRELNEQLQQRAALLDTANRELEAFSYSVSHDLRAPLRHVDGFIQLLKRGTAGQLDEKNLRYLTIIEEAARNMGVLIDELLAFSRMGRSPMTWTTLSLDGLVSEVCSAFATDTAGRNLTWVVEPLPVVKGDRAMLKLALMNLMGNAIKYTAKRDVAEVHIRAVQPPAELEDHVVIAIQDNGAGFDMTYAAKLFGVFQRLHSSSEFEGTGIGLANVRRIIARHNGRTWAEGRPGQGATFYFSMPRHQPTQEK